MMRLPTGDPEKPAARRFFEVPYDTTNVLSIVPQCNSNKAGGLAAPAWFIQYKYRHAQLNAGAAQVNCYCIYSLKNFSV
jgi:hypothetical protein